MKFGASPLRPPGLHRKLFAETEFEPVEWSASDLGIEDQVGLVNSPTKVG